MKTLYRSLLVACAILCTPSIIRAGSYTFTPDKMMTKNVMQDSIYVLDIYINNISSSNLTLKWVALENTLDTSWVDYSLCDYGTCYPGVPSGTQTMSSVTPGNQAFFGLNLTIKKSSGSGVVKLLVYDAVTGANTGDTVIYVINAVTGINETISLQEKVKIYPNPTSNILFINTNSVILNDGVIEIYNTIGEKVMEYGNKNRQADISPLPKGIYFIRMKTNKDQVITKKLNKL